MPRPKRHRCVAVSPDCVLFKPAGVPCRALEAVRLGFDELEALRLADLEGLYHERAAARMRVSRQTFGRIVESARRKVCEALVQGKSLKIEGGAIQMIDQRRFLCSECGNEWRVPFGSGRPHGCPACRSGDFHRVVAGRGGPVQAAGRGWHGRPGRQVRTRGGSR